MNIFFTSDTHYGHSNIVKGTTKWDLSGQTRGNQSVRDFDTLEEHDQAIVDGSRNPSKMCLNTLRRIIFIKLT